MIFFGRKKRIAKAQENLEKKVDREVAQHKKTTNKAINYVSESADNFNRVLKENGFTLKIHVAAGGKK